MRILELLSEKPRHGYQLHKDLDITTSTIYRHLNELEREGIVAIAEENGEKKIYMLTEKGKKLFNLLD